MATKEATLMVAEEAMAKVKVVMAVEVAMVEANKDQITVQVVKIKEEAVDPVGDTVETGVKAQGQEVKSKMMQRLYL